MLLVLKKLGVIKLKRKKFFEGINFLEEKKDHREKRKSYGL